MLPFAAELGPAREDWWDVRIRAVETVLHFDHPSLLWVLIHTDDGLAGTGETVGQPRATARVVHDMLAGLLVGEDASRIEWLWQRCFRAISYYGVGGAELRALSALDIALWDLLGQSTNLPVYALLGGASRNSVPVYNTCGEYGSTSDRRRFLDEPDKLASDLVAAGFPAMKIWPFDELARSRDGAYLTPRELEHGVSRVRKIRDAVGDSIEIIIEGHGLWNLPMAVRIARALEPWHPLWIEDFVYPDNPDVLRHLADATAVPVIASERLVTRFGLRSVIEGGGVQIVMFDPGWAGGISEGRRIADHAATYLLPIATHNCGGPIGHMANLHLCAYIPNLLLMETVRAFATGFYDELTEGVELPQGGQVALPGRPGLGVKLRTDLLSSPRVVRELTDSPGIEVVGLASGDPWQTVRF